MYGWGLVVEALGWRQGMLLAAGVGVGVVTLVFLLAFFPTPPKSSGDVLEGHHLDKILFLGGIFGGVIGGWLTDKVFGRLTTFLIACAAEGAMFFLIPYLNLFGLQIAAAVVGVGLIVAFVPSVSIPGDTDSGLTLSDVPTAIGLMLSIVAIGGATIPPLFSKIATEWGFDTAWQFQGAVTVGFALLAFLAQPKGAIRTGALKASN